MTTRFDPNQYAIDAGWDYESIEKTAKLGVAERDEEIIREILSEQGFEGDTLVGLAATASASLLRFCRQRIGEGIREASSLQTMIAEAREMQASGRYINGTVFHALADAVDRYRGALHKIARRYPCETADEMRRVAQETLGEG